MNRIKRILYNELVAGQTVGDWLLIACGLLLQIVTFLITSDSLLSLTTGMLGVFSVTLCSQRKVSSFLFGVFQIGCYMLLAARQHLYGELVENGFYMLTTLVGIYTWSRNYDAADSGNSVPPTFSQRMDGDIACFYLWSDRWLLAVALYVRPSSAAGHGELGSCLCCAGSYDVALSRAMDFLDCG